MDLFLCFPLYSEHLFFKTPKLAFIQRVRNYMDTPSYGIVEGVNQTITATYTDSNVDLPDKHDIISIVDVSCIFGSEMVFVERPDRFIKVF